MTNSPVDCAVLSAAVVASYADGRLDAAAAWSVEAHLPGCPACRTALSARVDADRLARNRAVVLARAGLHDPGLAARALRRCGVPEHIAVLLGATPSLRRSWLAGLLLVLAIVVGATQLAASLNPAVAQNLGGDGQFSVVAAAGSARWLGLLPFFILAPMVPLAAVATAFSPVLDPAYRLTAAAPVSKIWLLCVRSVAVIGASLVPAAIAALALPGPWWLALALLLPALAMCASALGLATVVPPLAAAAGVAAGWTAVVTAAALAANTASAAFGPAGQATAAVVLAAAITLILVRRNKIDYGWMG